MTPQTNIPKPDFPDRPGLAAADLARLIIVAMFCVFQYWLFTSTLEAYHAGDHSIVFGSFFASLGCFALAAGLVITGELAMLKHQRFMRISGKHDSAHSGVSDSPDKQNPLERNSP